MAKLFTQRFLAEEEDGATAIEYGLIAALIAVGIIAALTTIGQNLRTTFDRIGAGVADGNSRAPTTNNNNTQGGGTQPPTT